VRPPDVVIQGSHLRWRSIMPWANCHQSGIDSVEVPWLFIIMCWMVTNWSSLETCLKTFRQIMYKQTLNTLIGIKVMFQSTIPKWNFCIIWNFSIGNWNKQRTNETLAGILTTKQCCLPIILCMCLRQIYTFIHGLWREVVCFDSTEIWIELPLLGYYNDHF
jgi:hypothetical protein